ncbi:hypothetical protein Q1695_004843 [Nippostrongylus brasiliensis]|nr:hypothetical protein Q1695_004843 [Nippostrongylus brasiliensis]
MLAAEQARRGKSKELWPEDQPKSTINMTPEREIAMGSRKENPRTFSLVRSRSAEPKTLKTEKLFEIFTGKSSSSENIKGNPKNRKIKEDGEKTLKTQKLLEMFTGKSYSSGNKKDNPDNPKHNEENGERSLKTEELLEIFTGKSYTSRNKKSNPTNPKHNKEIGQSSDDSLSVSMSKEIAKKENTNKRPASKE